MPRRRAANEMLHFSTSPGFLQPLLIRTTIWCVSCVVFSHASFLGLDAVRKGKKHLAGQHVGVIRKEDGPKGRSGDYPKKMKEYKIWERNLVEQFKTRCKRELILDYMTGWGMWLAVCACCLVWLRGLPSQKGETAFEFTVFVGREGWGTPERKLVSEGTCLHF